MTDDQETRVEVSRLEDDKVRELEADDPEFQKVKKHLFENARDKRPCTKGTPTNIIRNLFNNLSESQIGLLCNEKDEKGNTAVHCAAEAGNLEICQFLHEKGASLVARGQNGMVPLQFAARYGCKENPENVWSCIEWIMGEYAAKKNEDKVLYDNCSKDKYGFTILHHAIQNTNWAENTLVVNNLLNSGAFKITDTDKQGNTSLHMAAQFDKMENHKIFDVFFDTLESSKGLDKYKDFQSDLWKCIQRENLHKKTPLHIACDIGNSDSVTQLITSMKKLKVNAKDIINSPDSNGHPPLHLAIESRNVDLMKILLDEGAEVSEESFNCAAR